MVSARKVFLSAALLVAVLVAAVVTAATHGAGVATFAGCMLVLLVVLVPAALWAAGNKGCRVRLADRDSS